MTRSPARYIKYDGPTEMSARLYTNGSQFNATFEKSVLTLYRLPFKRLREISNMRRN